MVKNSRILFIYILVIVFSSVIFLYTILKIRDGILYSQVIVSIIGEILILYGWIWMRRVFREKNEKELEEGLKELYAHSDKWQELYGQVQNRKKHISYMRHDMANHLQVINTITLNDNKVNNTSKDDIKSINGIKSDIHKIEEVLKKTSKVKYCDNYMLDIAIEQKIKELEERKINVAADIRLRGMEYAECEEVCIIFWLLTDCMADFLETGEKIYIKIQNREDFVEKEKIGIAYRIEGYTKNIKIRKITKSTPMHIAKKLLNNMTGSLVAKVDDEKAAVAGMFELIRRKG